MCVFIPYENITWISAVLNCAIVMSYSAKKSYNRDCIWTICLWSIFIFAASILYSHSTVSKVLFIGALQPCHFPEMAICFIYENLPTVLLMSFNKLASCPVPNKVCNRQTDIQTDAQILRHHIGVYVEFFFQLNLLHPYSLCSQGIINSLFWNSD